MIIADRVHTTKAVIPAERDRRKDTFLRRRFVPTVPDSRRLGPFCPARNEAKAAK
jgi:hypothetical protein